MPSTDASFIQPSQRLQKHGPAVKFVTGISVYCVYIICASFLSPRAADINSLSYFISAVRISMRLQRFTRKFYLQTIICCRVWLKTWLFPLYARLYPSELVPVTEHLPFGGCFYLKCPKISRVLLFFCERDLSGFEPLTLAVLVSCSTNQNMWRVVSAKCLASRWCLALSCDYIPPNLIFARNKKKRKKEKHKKK